MTLWEYMLYDAIIAFCAATLVGLYQYKRGYTFWKTTFQAWIGFVGLGVILIKLMNS